MESFFGVLGRGRIIVSGSNSCLFEGKRYQLAKTTWQADETIFNLLV